MKTCSWSALFVKQKMPDFYSDFFLETTDPTEQNFYRPSYLTGKQTRVFPKGATFGYHSFWLLDNTEGLVLLFFGIDFFPENF